jgi:hypothetical protein
MSKTHPMTIQVVVTFNATMNDLAKRKTVSAATRLLNVRVHSV